MNNKKTLVALLLIVVVGVVGLTFAYFTNSTSFDNEFQTQPYATSFVETFESPTNWTPGTTTSKTVIATNSGQVDQVVRVSYTEGWKDASNNNLSLTTTIGGQSVTAAVVNLDNQADWTKVGDYYYYNYKLGPSQSTTSFMSGVTFNSAIQASSENNCGEPVDDSTNHTSTVTCSTTGTGYDGATYTMNITIETAQFDNYSSIWASAPSITSYKS